MTRVRIEVHLKRGVTDPEGDNVRKALGLLGFKGVKGVHSAKLFLVDLAAEDATRAHADAEEMCRRLLANPVVHDYLIHVEDALPARAPAKGARARKS